jgi:hypothetical protein
MKNGDRVRVRKQDGFRWLDGTIELTSDPTGKALAISLADGTRGTDGLLIHPQFGSVLLLMRVPGAASHTYSDVASDVASGALVELEPQRP